MRRLPQVSASSLNSCCTLVRSVGCVATLAARRRATISVFPALSCSPRAIFRVSAPASHQLAGQRAAAACTTALRDKDIFRGPLKPQGDGRSLCWQNSSHFHWTRLSLSRSGVDFCRHVTSQELLAGLLPSFRNIHCKTRLSTVAEDQCSACVARDPIPHSEGPLHSWGRSHVNRYRRAHHGPAGGGVLSPLFAAYCQHRRLTGLKRNKTPGDLSGRSQHLARGVAISSGCAAVKGKPVLWLLARLLLNRSLVNV